MCTDRSKAVLLLWIFFVFVLSCVCYVYVRVCLIVLCGHLLGKGWPLGSRLWCLTVSLSLSHWYPGSGVVLDCIDSWYLHPYLLCSRTTTQWRWWGSKPRSLSLESSTLPLSHCAPIPTISSTDKSLSWNHHRVWSPTHRRAIKAHPIPRMQHLCLHRRSETT